MDLLQLDHNFRNLSISPTQSPPQKHRGLLPGPLAYGLAPKHHYHHHLPPSPGLIHPPPSPHPFLPPHYSPAHHHPLVHPRPPLMHPPHPPLIMPHSPRSILSLQAPPEILHQIQYPQPFPFSHPFRFPYVFRIFPDQANLFQILLRYHHPENPSSQLPLDSLLTNFRLLPPEDQLTTFFSSQYLPPTETKLRWQIAFDTLHILRQVYPLCQVFVFGSLLTTLGTANSDVDMYVDLRGDNGCFLFHQKHPVRVVKLMRDDVEEVVLRNCRCPHYPYQNYAENVKAWGKRVPFLRYVHAPSGISCDLSFGNRISVQNSKLLLFYMEYEPRVRPLLVFLRYWLHFHGLAGELKIKQYALSLMVLVYLMKLDSLPSVVYLQVLEKHQRKCHGIPGNPDEIEGWDCSFCDNVQRVEHAYRPAGRNTLETPNKFLKLVEGFFELYSGLNFEKKVICAWTGKILNKEVFMTQIRKELVAKGKDTLSLEKYFQPKQPLCIQDPFVLDFNVGGVAKIETVQEFQEMCKRTVKNVHVVKEEVGKVCILDFLNFSRNSDDS